MGGINYKLKWSFAVRFCEPNGTGDINNQNATDELRKNSKTNTQNEDIMKNLFHALEKNSILSNRLIFFSSFILLYIYKNI